MAISDVLYNVLNGIQKHLKAMPDGTHAEIIAGYDLQDDMLKVKSVQKKWRDSFLGSGIDATKWTGVVAVGGAIGVSGGLLTIGSGVTASAETSLTSVETFSVPFRVQFHLALSQRIANQDFIVEAVSVDPITLVPNGLHSLGWKFNGTTATSGVYFVQNGGLAALDSALSTIPTTVSGSIYEIEPFADEAWFHGGVMDSTSGRSTSYRRHQQIPDPNAVYKLRIRWKNGATAPATSTNASMQFIACQDYAELTAEITAGRGQVVQGQAIGVALVSPLVAGAAQIGNVGGVAAHDAVVSGNPERIAGRAVSAAYTAVASGDVADLITTLQGVQVVRPWQIPELEWAYAAAAGGVINTADVILAAAAGAGLRRYITSLTLSNASAVATEVVLKDGATVIWRGHLPANAAMTEISFMNPLKTTANAALNMACATTGAAVYVNAQGFTAV